MNDALLPGEKVLAARPANLMFGFESDEKAPTTQAEALILLAKLVPQMIKARSLGGKLHVTNYRLYFATHRLNTTRGSCSVFLPTILWDQPVAGLVSGQWVVRSGTASHRFAVRDPKELSQLLRQTQEKPLDVAALKEHARANLEKVGAGISTLFAVKDIEKLVSEKQASSIQLVGLMNAHELLSA